MAGTDGFEVEGKIIEARSDRVFRVQLSNRHCLLGFIPGKNRKLHRQLAVGDKVNVRVSPYDLSEGRIILAAEKN